MSGIFIVEDDEIIADEISRHLVAWGFKVSKAKDFSKVTEEIAAFDPALILLDISLPFYNGFHWCSKIRNLSSVPIVFLSSASDNMNIVMAMNMGGDDFIPKPFDLTVLTAKIQAILRRSATPQQNVQELVFGDIMLDIGRTTIYYKNSFCELSKNECRIMEILIKAMGKTVSREDIICSLWQDESFVDDNTLTVNITRIRKKLESIGLNNFITTKKGIGYMLSQN